MAAILLKVPGIKLFSKFSPHYPQVCAILRLNKQNILEINVATFLKNIIKIKALLKFTYLCIYNQ